MSPALIISRLFRLARRRDQLIAAALLLMLLPLTSALAVRLDSVYTAEVDLQGSLAPAFDEALGRVLVKASGSPALGAPAARKGLVRDASALVRRYSKLPGNRICVEFDGAQVRALLDAAGQPVWGVERPLLAIWYAMDAGSGQRTILPGADAGEPDELAPVRDVIVATAEERGLPLVFPLVDAEDLSRLSFADLWGDFREPIVDASARYGAEGVLIGRARSFAADDPRVRWTLVAGADQFSWEGSVASGPSQAADYLAQRLVTYADAAGKLRLQIAGIDGFDKYMRLRNYLRSLSVVDNMQVARVSQDLIQFDLNVRGDAARVARTLDSGPLLDRVAAGPAASGGRAADLTYRWAGTK